MKKADILNMPAGREMDILIAEKFGLYAKFPKKGDSFVIVGDGHLFYVPQFSTEISAAWKLVEKLREDKFRFYMRIVGTYYGAEIQKGDARGFGTGWIDAETAPLAICWVALLTVADD